MNYSGPFDANASSHSAASLNGEGFLFGPKPAFIQHHASDAHVVVPDAHLLFSGNYTRIGSDLIIADADHKLVVGGYFKGDTRPALMSTDGAALSGQIVEALTGHVHYAQAAATAPAAQVIGHVLKMSGSASAVRNGVSVELHIGDAVQKGDVIQTGSDSSIGMTFIDGSAFGMTSNARMVLNEMIYDPNGSSNSSLMSLVQGTITFVAGQTAKNGNMRVDTPVATMGIRGTAVLVEIGADNGPTKFSVLVEPDGHTGSYNLYDKSTGQLIGTVSQAGQVTFVSASGIGQPPTAIEQLKTMQDQQQEKALIQQVFQLYFPNYNPDNSDPKTQKFGSTSYNNLAEITFTTNNFNNQTYLTQIELRIAVTDPHTGVTTYQNRLFFNTKAVFSADSVFGDQAFTSTTQTFKFQDVVHIDDPDIGNAPFYDIGVPFVAGSAVIKSAESSIGNVSETFLKSLIHINQTTGQVTFDRQQFNFLDDGQTVTIRIQVTATSGPDTGHVIIPITITGANDAPTIVLGDPLHPSVIAGAVTEDMPANASSLTANGVISFQDVDLTDAHTASVALTSTASTLPGFVNNTTKIGTFTIDPVSENLTDNDNHGSVGWHFTLDDNDPTLQSLAKGQTITQTYTITIKDDNGVPVTQTVTITINGTNDAPVLTADSSVHNTIEIADTTGAPNSTVDTATGTLAFIDVDLSDTHQASTAIHQNADHTPSVTWSGGSYSGIPQATRDALMGAMTALVDENNTDTSNHGALNWTFSLPDHLLDFLADGETLTIVYDVTITDNNGASSTQQVTIQIGASNDQPVISAINATGAVTEDVAAQSGVLHDTGSVTFTDTDLTDTHTAQVAYTGGTHSSGVTISQDLALALKDALTVPSSTLAAGDHGFDWSFDLDNSLVQYLAAGETVTATYTIIVTDSSQTDNAGSAPKTVTITITGTNDAPVITSTLSDAAGAIGELADTTSSSAPDPVGGTITFGDVDLTDTHQATEGGLSFSWSGGSLTGAQVLALTAASARTLTPHDSTGTGEGSVDWTYKITDGALDFLADGETLTVIYDITVTDFHGNTANGTSATQQVTVTITGTNDAPIIAADTSGTAGTNVHDLTEGNNGLSTSGTLAVTDADITNTVAASVFGVAIGGTGAAYLPSNLNAAALNAMFSVDTGNVIDNTHTTGTIHWNFNSAGEAFNFLAQGETLILTYTVRATDSDASHATGDQTVVIQITGTNDTPTVATVLSDDKNEGDTAFAKDLLSGASDRDHGETATLAVVAASLSYKIDSAAASSTIPNGLTLASDGHTLTIDPNSTAFDHLAVNQSTTIAVDYDIADIHGAIVHQTETITIHGTNDAPTVSAALVDSLNEGDSVLHRDLLTNASDVDDGETATLSVVANSVTYTVGTGAASSTIPAGLTLASDGHTLTIDPNSAAFDHLAVGQSTTIVVSYDITDVHNAIVHQTETITINGTNDAPTVSGPVTATVAEDAAPSVLNALANASDVDDGHVLSVVNVPAAGSLPAGVTYDAVTHTFTLDPTNAAYQHLGAGDSTVVTVNYGVSDGIAPNPTAASVSWTVTGVNDSPVINIDNVKPVEDPSGNGVMTVSGVTVSDVDAGSDVFTVTAHADHGSVATVSGQSLDSGVPGGGFTGTFAQVSSLFTDGAVYTPNYAALTATDKVTLTVTDGHGGSDAVNFIFKQYATGGVTLDGTAGKDWILSSTGNDTMTGHGGADNFVFAAGSGNDTITDFTSGTDHIVLNGYGAPFTDQASFSQWLTDQVTDTANGAVIHLDASDSITLTGVAKANLAAHDFIIHPAGA